ncbi:MAG: hypothetical protein AAGI69_27700 [Cyanobacteria bacterium P01_H01_bin.21]
MTCLHAMDWDKVSIPQIDNTKVQIQKLGGLDYCKLIVIANLMAQSQSQIGQTALYTYLQETWAQHEERLTVEANKRGISIEECFTEIVKEALGGK